MHWKIPKTYSLLQNWFKHWKTHRRNIFTNIWWESIPMKGTTILKSTLARFTIPRWHNKGVIKLTLCILGVNSICKSKSRREVVWGLILKTFKYNNEKLIDPTIMQFVPMIVWHYTVRWVQYQNILYGQY